jgi:hypothetical protein
MNGVPLNIAPQNNTKMELRDSTLVILDAVLKYDG